MSAVIFTNWNAGTDEKDVPFTLDWTSSATIRSAPRKCLYVEALRQAVLEKLSVVDDVSQTGSLGTILKGISPYQGYNLDYFDKSNYPQFYAPVIKESFFGRFLDASTAVVDPLNRYPLSGVVNQLYYSLAGLLTVFVNTTIANGEYHNYSNFGTAAWSPSDAGKIPMWTQALMTDHLVKNHAVIPMTYNRSNFSVIYVASALSGYTYESFEFAEAIWEIRQTLDHLTAIRRLNDVLAINGTASFPSVPMFSYSKTRLLQNTTSRGGNSSKTVEIEGTGPAFTLNAAPADQVASARSKLDTEWSNGYPINTWSDSAQAGNVEASGLIYENLSTGTQERYPTATYPADAFIEKYEGTSALTPADYGNVGTLVTNVTADKTKHTYAIYNKKFNCTYDIYERFLNNPTWGSTQTSVDYKLFWVYYKDSMFGAPNYNNYYYLQWRYMPAGQIYQGIAIAYFGAATSHIITGSTPVGAFLVDSGGFVVTNVPMPGDGYCITQIDSWSQALDVTPATLNYFGISFSAVFYNSLYKIATGSYTTPATPLGLTSGVDSETTPTYPAKPTYNGCRYVATSKIDHTGTYAYTVVMSDFHPGYRISVSNNPVAVLKFNVVGGFTFQ